MDAFLFGLLAAFWGGSFVAIKFAVDAFPPSFCAMLRVGVALAALSIVFVGERRKLRVRGPALRRMWLAGLFAQGIPFAFLFWGERRVSPGLAGIINGTVPVWTFLLGYVSGAETFTRRKTAGLALGFIGIAVICAPMLSFSGTRRELLGATAVFVMALSYGVGTRLTRAILSGKNPADFRANAFHQNCASVVFLALVSRFTETWPSATAVAGSPAAVAAILYLGVCSTAAAFLIYFHLIRQWGAVRASAVTYVVPVVALFWDYVFFKTVPSPAEIVGVAAVLAGVRLLNARAA